MSDAVMEAGLPASRGIGTARRAGAALLLALIAFALIGPLLAIDPARQDLRDILAPMGGEYLLGTDHLGRSILARLAHAARLSLGFAALSLLAAAIPGTLLGLVAAWHGGWIDRALSILADMILALPGLLLVLVVAAFAPGDIRVLFLGVSVALWVEFFRVVRASAAGILASPEVEAARLLGFGPAHIVRRHVAPRIAPVLATLAAFGVGGAVITISTLSFVNVGVRPPTPEWGNMIVELMPYFEEAPAHVLAPAACIFLLLIALNLLAGKDPR